MDREVEEIRFLLTSQYIADAGRLFPVLEGPDVAVKATSNQPLYPQVIELGYALRR